MNYFKILFLSLISSLSLLAMELPEQKLAVQDSSLRDQSMDAVIKQLNYLLLTDPDAIHKLCLNDETFTQKLKEKILKSGLFQEDQAFLSISNNITSIAILDKENHIIAVAREDGIIEIIDLKNRKTLKTIEAYKLLPEVFSALHCDERRYFLTLQLISNDMVLIDDGGRHYYCLNIINNSCKPILHDAFLREVFIINDHTIGYIEEGKSKIVILDINSDTYNVLDCDQKIYKAKMLDKNRLVAVMRNKFVLWDLCSLSKIVEIPQECASGTPEAILLTNLIKEAPDLLFTIYTYRDNNHICIQDWNPSLIKEVTNCSNFIKSSEFKEACVLIKYQVEEFSIVHKNSERLVIEHFLTCLNSLNKHTLIIGAGCTIQLKNIFETYSLSQLLEYMKKNAQKHTAHIDLKQLNPVIVTDFIFLRQHAEFYQKNLVFGQPDPEEEKKDKIKFLQDKLKKLIEKYGLKDSMKVSYLFELLSFAIPTKDQLIVDAIISLLCFELKPLTIAEWKSLPLDLRKVGCVAFICTDFDNQQKVIVMPEYIASQSPVLCKMFNSGFKESNEKVMYVNSEYDSRCVSILKEFLYKVFWDLSAYLLERVNARSYTQLKKGHLEIYEGYFRLIQSLYSHIETIPVEIILLLHEWQIPKIQYFTEYFFNEASKTVGELQELFNTLPYDCYIHFLPVILCNPNVEIIQIQMELLCDMLINTKRYDRYFCIEKFIHLLTERFKNVPGKKDFELLFEDYARFIANHITEILKWNPKFLEWIENYNVPEIAQPLQNKIFALS